MQCHVADFPSARRQRASLMYASCRHETRSVRVLPENVYSRSDGTSVSQMDNRTHRDVRSQISLNEAEYDAPKEVWRNGATNKKVSSVAPTLLLYACQIGPSSPQMPQESWAYRRPAPPTHHQKTAGNPAQHLFLLPRNGGSHLDSLESRRHSETQNADESTSGDYSFARRVGGSG